MKRTIKYIRFSCRGILLVALFASCKKMDDYKKFADGGEISYPTTFDSLKVIPGKNRVMITGLLIGDPKVTKYRVFWNSGSDSLEAAIQRSGGIDTLRQIIPNLPEGPMTFTLRTYDAAGNRSIPMLITGNVYGDNFQTSVNERGNRVVLRYLLAMNGTGVIDWANVDAYIGVLGMRLQYYDANDVAHDTIVVSGLKDQQTVLPNISVNRPIVYNTLYLPDTVGIDTFTVTSRTLAPIEEVGLLNCKPPVANVENDGDRWATLRDWITNDAAKNHQKDGKWYGGTDRSGNAMIYFEAGWGAAAIPNGKIHQVATLPPGKYRFEGIVDWWNVGSRNDVYLMAVQGTNGLPDTDNLNASIGYKKLDNSSAVQLNFELTQTTTLSIGVLLWMADDGEAIRFKSMSLKVVH